MGKLWLLSHHAKQNRHERTQKRGAEQEELRNRQSSNP
jgi:hypothetical protein